MTEPIQSGRAPVHSGQCLAVLVGSPRLLDVRTRSVDQMRLVNALCRFVEMAQKQRPAGMTEEE